MSDNIPRWEFPAIVYPRFNYFRDRLLRLVPRFRKRIIEGNLDEVLFRGKEMIKEIEDNAKCLEEKLSVTILHDESVDSATVTKFTPKCFVVGDIEEENIKPTLKHISMSTFTEFVHEMCIHHPRIFVVLFNAEKKGVREFLNGMSIAQLKNTVIHDVSTGKSRQLHACTNSDIDLGWVNDEQPSVSVMKNIQDLLESKAVDVIEDIATFIQSFELTDGTLPDRSLFNDVSFTLKDYLRQPHASKELCEVSNVECGFKSSKQKKVLSSNGIQEYQVRITKDEFTKMCSHIARYTNHKSCEHLSLQYRLKPAITNAFLRSSVFDFEDEFVAHILKCLPYSKSYFEMYPDEIAKFFLRTCITNMAEFLTKVENIIKARFEIVNALDKMLFEIRAILRQTKVKLKIISDKDLAPPPVLPLELQHDLLSLDGIEGCGTIYGHLTLHSSLKPTQYTFYEIRTILEKHNYWHIFRLETMSCKGEQAGCYNDVEIGNTLKVKLTVEEKAKLQQKYPEQNIEYTDCYRYGTLGCFVKVKKRGSEESPELYGVTCGHVLLDCHPSVEICTSNGDKPFGETSAHLMYMDEETIDIAVIKVNSHIDPDLDTRFKLRTADGEYFRKSTFYNDKVMSVVLDGKDVFKLGASTELTRALIISVDYRMKRIAEERNLTLSNILLADLDNPGTPFSSSGDSGSSVCFDRPEDEHIFIVSITF